MPVPMPARASHHAAPLVINGEMDIAAATGAGSAATVSERLDAIEASTARRLGALAPDNTIATRRTAWRCWQRFLTAAALPEGTLSVGTLLQFAEWMDSVAMAPSTMHTYVASVVVEARVHYPSREEALAAVPKGIAAPVFDAIRHMAKNAAYNHERRGRGKSPAIHPLSVRAVVSSLDISRRIGLRDKALVLIWYALGARGAEVAHLNIEDVELVVDDAAPGMYLHLTATKTGSRRPFIPFDDVEPQLCPVRSWLAWLDSLRQAPHGPAAFPQLTWKGTVKNAALTPAGVRDRLQLLFDAAGQMCRGGHGMRRGHIQHSLRQGKNPEDVRQHVGLKEGSSAWPQYVEEWDSRRNSSAAGIMR
jgi:integrase